MAELGTLGLVVKQISRCGEYKTCFILSPGHFSNKLFTFNYSFFIDG